jgi:hypothetical protein
LCVCQYLGVWTRPHACLAGALPFEPFFQPFLCWLFLR